MKINAKPQIYKDMIQYLLDTTGYSLENIALLSNCSTKNLLSIYNHNVIPLNFTSEVKLVQLFQIILEFNLNHKDHTRGLK